MTDEEKVKQRWPDAYAEKLDGEWAIFEGLPAAALKYSGWHKTAAEAWADAARRLEDK